MKLASLSRGRTGCLAQSANRLFGTGPLFLTDNPNRRNRYQVVPNTKLNTLVSNQQPEQAQLVSGSLQNIFFCTFPVVYWLVFRKGKGECCVFCYEGWLCFGGVMIPKSLGSTLGLVLSFLHCTLPQTFDGSTPPSTLQEPSVRHLTISCRW